jgi:hypothetical protein
LYHDERSRERTGCRWNGWRSWRRGGRRRRFWVVVGQAVVAVLLAGEEFLVRGGFGCKWRRKVV